MRTPSWAVAPLALAVALTSACSAGGSRDHDDLAVPTWDAPSPDDVRLLSLTGTLTLDDDGCLRLDTGSVSGVVTPIWPDGSEAERDGTSAVVDPGGDADAIEVGRRVRLAGGFSSEQYEDVTCGGQDGAPAFEVDQVITGL